MKGKDKSINNWLLTMSQTSMEHIIGQDVAETKSWKTGIYSQKLRTFLDYFCIFSLNSLEDSSYSLVLI